LSTLTIKITSGHLESYEALLLQLSDPDSAPAVERLELVFGETTQVFPTAFALMAAYVGRTRAPSARPLVSRRFGSNPQSAKLERAMDAIGFIAAVAGRNVEHKPDTGVIALTPLLPTTDPDSMARELIDEICVTAQPTRDAKETLYVVVSEIVENVVLHGQGEGPAFLCGQLSTQKRKLELCIVDSGTGVKSSFENGKDAVVAKRVASGESALSIAVEAGTTSKGAGHTGFGLFAASEAARLTKGIFRLTSGNETVIVSREGEKHRTHAPWSGTVVNFLINIDKLGSIAEVYRELPLTRGHDERFLGA